ncbi:MAG: hypothetical protein HKP22_05925 [Gammaproteobacteria bacterium]|nr:hypothetical protein [Gammaproteobacteria bacterium]
MTEHKGITNLMRDSADETEKQQAYQAMLEYLVSIGNFADVSKADADANVRVQFCEEIGLFADDEQLKNASIYEKKLQVLINANGLQDIIAENNGAIPRPNSSEAIQRYRSEESDASSLDTESVLGDDAVAETFEDEINEQSQTSTGLSSVKRNYLLKAAMHLGISAVFTIIVFASLMLLFSHQQQLQIIKYGFMLSAVLLFIFVGLYEVSSKILARARLSVGLSLFITMATLSGLLFMQQWDESTFTVRDGLFGLVVNPIVRSVIDSGPYWLGIVIVVIASLIFIAIQTADFLQNKKGEKSRQGNSRSPI